MRRELYLGGKNFVIYSNYRFPLILFGRLYPHILHDRNCLSTETGYHELCNRQEETKLFHLLGCYSLPQPRYLMEHYNHCPHHAILSRKTMPRTPDAIMLCLS